MVDRPDQEQLSRAPRKTVLSVAGAMSGIKEGDGVGHPCIVVDFATVSAAPFEEFSWLYYHLGDVVSQALSMFGSRLSPAQPFIVGSLEITDGAPLGPILLSIP